MEFAPLGHARVSKHQTPRQLAEFLDREIAFVFGKILALAVLSDLPDPVATVHHGTKVAERNGDQILTP